jgi:simple sugar transport system substrate-binding protein
MFRPRNRAVGAALLMVVLILTACSSTGGKKAAEAADAGTGVEAGHASTPHCTIAMITHAGPGQTFCDTDRYGGVAAAAKDNFTLKYAGNPDPTQQAQLITDAINSHVNAIAVTDPTRRLCARPSRRPGRPASR